MDNYNGPKHEHPIFQKIPTGYRFKPYEHELVLHYLLNKAFSPENLPPHKIIDENIYKFDPEKLYEMAPNYGEEERYFFSSRDRKYTNGSRPNRATPGGYWKATGADKKVKDNGKTIGVKKTLVFYQKLPSANGKKEHKKTDWIMHEFKLPDGTGKPRQRNGLRDMTLDDCVLCKIYEHKRARKDENKKQKATTPVNNAIVEVGQNPIPVAMYHQYGPPPPMWNHQHQQFATMPSFVDNAGYQGFVENLTQGYQHPSDSYLNDPSQMSGPPMDNSSFVGNSTPEVFTNHENYVHDHNMMVGFPAVSDNFISPKQLRRYSL